MGYWLDPAKIRPRGGGQLQAVEAVEAIVGGATLRVNPLDTPLAGPAGAAFMPFSAASPDFGAGLRFNLHNNKWGTNFPMRWEGDLLARFRLEVTA